MSTGLEVDAVTVAGTTSTVVSGLSLTARPGTVVEVTGGSAAGKSTLLAALAGVHPLTGGRVLLDGRAVDPARVGYADQQHVLVPALTAAENLAVRSLSGRRRGDGLPASQWRAIEHALAALGLPESSWHNLAEQLSGGQQQRVAVARALVGAPALLCLDDPTSELDELSSRPLWSAVDDAVAAGAVLVLVPPPSGAPLRAPVSARVALPGRRVAV